MTRLRHSIHFIRGSSLLAWPSLVVFMVVSMSPNLLFDVLTLHGPLIPWVVAAGIGTMAGLGVLALATPALRWKWTPPADASATIGVLALAAVTKSAVVGLFVAGMPLAVVAEVPAALPQGQRMLTNLLYTLLAMGVTIAAVTASHEQRDRRLLLIAEQQRLLDANAAMSDRLAQAQEDLRRETHEVLDPALASVRELLEAGEDRADTARVVDALSAAVSDVIRPMSHRYSGEAAPIEALPPPRDLAPVGVMSWLRDRVDAPAAIRPVPITALSVLGFAMMAPIAKAPLPAYILTLSMFAVTAVVLLVIRAAWPPIWRRIPAGWAIVALAGVCLIVYMSLGLLFSWDAWSDSWMRFWLMSAGYRTIMSVAVAMFVMVTQRRSEVDAEIYEVNIGLERHVAAMRREAWSIRRQMSLVLHGSVQSVLVSSIMILSREGAHHRAEEVRLRLDQALRAIDLDNEASDVVEHGLREIVGLWAPISEISVEVSPAASAALAAHPGRRSACLEIVREAVSNAVRHGRATHVHMSIELDDQDLVTIRVRDDGAGLSDEAAAGRLRGLGSAMMDEVCLNWSRESGGRQADGIQGPGLTVIAVLA